MARRLTVIALGVLFMLVCNVYVDFDNDGSFATSGDDISAQWKTTRIAAGIQSEHDHIANVGTCTITLHNEDRRFSPENTGGTYYGKLKPGLPVKVDYYDTETFETGTIFRGWTQAWMPSSGHIHGDRECTLHCADGMETLRNAEINLPLQNDTTAGPLFKKVCAQAFRGGVSTGTIYITDPPSNGDEVTIGDTTYTFRTSLTPAAYEVLIDAGRYHPSDPLSFDGIEDATLNLADAINADVGIGTYYANGTARNTQVTAESYPAIGWASSNQDTGLDLNNSATGYSKLAAWAYGASMTTFGEEDEPNAYYDRVYLWMKKTGAPAGTMTISLVTQDDPAFRPSTTLIDANATGTVLESSLSTSYGWVEFVFADEVLLPIGEDVWIVLETDRAADAANYVTWGAEAVASTGRMWSEYYDGSWNNNAPVGMIGWLPGRVIVTANARGAWGNDIILDSGAYHANADTFTANKGAIVSGSLSDTNDEDGVYFVLSEVGGAPPGFNYDLDHTVTGTGIEVVAVIDYAGSAGHTVLLRARDWAGAVTDTLGTITSGLNTYRFALDPKYTSGGGVVRINLYHSSAGNATHQIRIDHIFVIHDEPSTTTSISFSGAVLAGGSDAPAGLIDFEDGKQTFGYAADNWQPDATNGLDAARDIAQSEGGFIITQRDGTITLRDRDWLAEQQLTATSLALVDHPDIARGAVDIGDITNEWRVRWNPRGVQDSGVIAVSNETIKVPGRKWKQRHNPTDENTDAGDVVVRIPYIETGTGRIVGATDIIAPVETTDVDNPDDFKVIRSTDAGSRLVTGKVTLSLAVEATALVATFSNSAYNTLLVKDLQVRGSAIRIYETQDVVLSDTTSIDAYGKRPRIYIIALPSIQEFAQSIAEYRLARYKNAIYRVPSISFSGTKRVNDTHLWSLDLFDIVTLSDTQTGLDAARYMIIGWRCTMSHSGQTLQWDVRRMDDQTFGIWDSTTWDNCVWGV